MVQIWRLPTFAISIFKTNTFIWFYYSERCSLWSVARSLAHSEGNHNNTEKPHLSVVKKTKSRRIGDLISHDHSLRQGSVPRYQGPAPRIPQRYKTKMRRFLELPLEKQDNFNMKIRPGRELPHQGVAPPCPSTYPTSSWTSTTSTWWRRRRRRPGKHPSPQETNFYKITM